MNILKEALADLNNPIEMEPKSGLLKWGKFQIRIIYEDMSFKDYYIKLKKSYKITIKGRDYIVIPKAILRGKRPSLTYYFNNPFPIFYQHQGSELNSLELYKDAEKAVIPKDEKELLAKTKIDSETLNNLLTTNIIKGLYPKKGITPMFWIIIAVVVFVMLLIILHFTGVIDIYGIMGVKTGG